jgi:hypothetical protein
LALGALYFLPLAVVGYILYTSWDQVTAYDWTFNGLYLGLSFLGYVLALVFVVVMWTLILNRFEEPTDFMREARIYTLSAIYRRLPLGGGLWQAVGRVYLYVQEGVSGRAISLGMIWEAIVGLFSSFLVWLLLSPFSLVDDWERSLPLVILLVAVLLGVLLFPSSLCRAFNWILKRLSQPTLALTIRRYDVVAWVGIYALNWVSGGLLLYFFARAIAPDLSWRYVVPVVGAWAGTSFLGRIANFLPVKLGIGEVVLSVLLGQYIPMSKAMAIAILFRIWVTVIEVVWAVGLALIHRWGTEKGK